MHHESAVLHGGYRQTLCRLSLFARRDSCNADWSKPLSLLPSGIQYVELARSLCSVRPRTPLCIFARFSGPQLKRESTSACITHVFRALNHSVRKEFSEHASQRFEQVHLRGTTIAYQTPHIAQRVL